MNNFKLIKVFLSPLHFSACISISINCVCVMQYSSSYIYIGSAMLIGFCTVKIEKPFWHWVKTKSVLNSLGFSHSSMPPNAIEQDIYNVTTESLQRIWFHNLLSSTTIQSCYCTQYLATVPFTTQPSRICMERINC